MIFRKILSDRVKDIVWTWTFKRLFNKYVSILDKMAFNEPFPIDYIAAFAITAIFLGAMFMLVLLSLLVLTCAMTHIKAFLICASIAVVILLLIFLAKYALKKGYCKHHETTIYC